MHFFSFAWALALFATLFLVANVVATRSSAPAVVLADGTRLVGGVEQPSGGVAYLGIRYAQAPVGDLRWAPPQPASGTAASAASAVVDASQYGAACPQKSAPFFPMPPGVDFDEDCLFLNVWVPPATGRAGGGGGGKPVMLWLHGGSFTWGSGAEYNASQLAAESDAVVVTINYRLSVLGFFALPGQPNGTAMNFALLDQQLAMEWVHKNIGSFGGDATRLTLAGQSSGGASVLLQALLQRAPQKPLFARALIESPGIFVFPNASQMQDIGALFAQSSGLCANVSIDDYAAMLACLRRQPWHDVLYDNRLYGLFLPVVDGEQLRSEPAGMLMRGEFARGLDWLLGHNAAEGNFLAFQALGGKSTELSYAAYQQMVQQSFGLVSPALADDVLSIYAGLEPPAAPNHFAQLAAAMGNFLVDCGTQIIATYVARDAASAVYLYEFAHTPAHWLYSQLNATHTAELPFIFPAPWPLSLANLTAAEQQLSGAMIDMWGAFMAAGSPSSAAAAGGYEWPRFRPSAGAADLLLIDLPASAPAPANASFPFCSAWDRDYFLTSGAFLPPLA